MMLTEPVRISSHLIRTLEPEGSLTSPLSPTSNVRPLIIAVRLGGLVMPLSVKAASITGLGPAPGVGGGSGWFEPGKKGLRPSLMVAGMTKTDLGTSAWARLLVPPAGAAAAGALAPCTAAAHSTRQGAISMSQLRTKKFCGFIIIKTCWA